MLWLEHFLYHPMTSMTILLHLVWMIRLQTAFQISQKRHEILDLPITLPILWIFFSVFKIWAQMLEWNTVTVFIEALKFRVEMWLIDCETIVNFQNACLVSDCCLSKVFLCCIALRSISVWCLLFKANEGKTARQIVVFIFIQWEAQKK